MMKIAVIGFGAAAIGFLEGVKDMSHEIHVFEKSRDVYSSGISGIRADGKLFVSSGMGGDMEIDIELQKKFVDYYIACSAEGKFEKGLSFHNPMYYKKFYEGGFEPIMAEFSHLGTDQLQGVLKTIYDNFSSKKNIHFHFNNEVKEIEINDDTVTINGKDKFDHVVVTVGRSGHKLVRTLISKYPEMVLENTSVDFGVRLELPDHIVEDINREMYEFKVRFRSRTGYMVRSFCNNPSGYVVIENYGDFVTVNGHSKINEKSTNTNFAILTTVELTEPFNDPIGYGSHIAKLTNILAGKDKVILQTLRDFRNSKRTKKVYRVQPTLPSERFIMGDINLAYPRRIVESVLDFIDHLNAVVPGIGNDDNLVYAPEIKFYSNKLSNTQFRNLWFAGDCSGFTRSIIYATAHGYMLAEELRSKR